MKNLFLIIAFVFMSNMAFPQETEAENELAYFVVLYTLGETWDVSKQPHEQTYFKDHSAHLSELRKTSKIVLGARYSDTGMIVLKVKDEEEAKDLIHQDPAIQNKMFKAEIFPYFPFYKGCLE